MTKCASSLGSPWGIPIFPVLVVAIGVLSGVAA
jgi:hypothetical protein